MIERDSRTSRTESSQDDNERQVVGPVERPTTDAVALDEVDTSSKKERDL